MSINKEVADKIRELVTVNNNNISELESLLREARDRNLEIDLMDGTTTEINHELDGLTAFKIRIVKILEKRTL